MLLNGSCIEKGLPCRLRSSLVYKTNNLILWPLSTITTFRTHIHTHVNADTMTNLAQRAKSGKR